MLYWGLDDDLVVSILLMNLVALYVAFDITRVSKGAPRGWYVIIGAFALYLLYRGVQLYFDVQSPVNSIDTWEAFISSLASVLLLVGLVMLNRNFRSHLSSVPSS